MSVSAPMRLERLRCWACALGLSMAGASLVGSLIAGFASLLAARWLEGLWLSLIGAAFLSCLGFFVTEGIRDAIRRQTRPNVKTRDHCHDTVTKAIPASPPVVPAPPSPVRPLGERLESLDRRSVALAAKTRARGRA